MYSVVRIEALSLALFVYVHVCASGHLLLVSLSPDQYKRINSTTQNLPDPSVSQVVTDSITEKTAMCDQPVANAAFPVSEHRPYYLKYSTSTFVF